MYHIRFWVDLVVNAHFRLTYLMSWLMLKCGSWSIESNDALVYDDTLTREVSQGSILETLLSVHRTYLLRHFLC